MAEDGFESFPKIHRLSREAIITEKLDGTNAQITILDCQDPLREGPMGAFEIANNGNGLVMYAGSRTRWIMPGKTTDNYGFAGWVRNNAEDLFSLGIGTHYGEWWGQGIQRGYGLKEKRFSLFNVARWGDLEHRIGTMDSDVNAVKRQRPACCHVVPVLGSGIFDTNAVEVGLSLLRIQGSYAAPGFMNPEGVVVFHVASRTPFKKTLEKDEEPKSKQKAS